MSITTAVVPIAGWGSRLLPVSLLTAKEFLPLGNKPAIQHIAEELAEAGITKIVFVASTRKQSVTNLFVHNSQIVDKLTGSKAYLKDLIWSCSSHAGVEIAIEIQQEQLGLGHAILCAEPSVGSQPFVVALGDCLIGLPQQAAILEMMIQQFQNHDAAAVISFEKVPDDRVHKYGIAKPKSVNGNVFELEDLIEKPAPNEAPSNFAICGRYVLSPSIFQILKNAEPGAGGEIQLTDAIRHQMAHELKTYGVLLPDGVNRHDVGDIKTYTKSFVEFALSNTELRPFVESAIHNSKTKTEV